MSTQLPIVILLLKIVLLLRNGWKDDANVLKMAPQQPCIKYSLWWLNVGHVQTWPSWMSTDIWRGFLTPVQEMSAQNTLLTPVKGPENLRISEKGISSHSYVTSVNQMCPGLSLGTENELYRRFLSGTMKLYDSSREVPTSRLLFGSYLAWVQSQTGYWSFNPSYSYTNLSEVFLISLPLERSHWCPWPGYSSHLRW